MTKTMLPSRLRGDAITIGQCSRTGWTTTFAKTSNSIITSLFPQSETPLKGDLCSSRLRSLPDSFL